MAKLNILYLETALEQINSTALLPDKTLCQVPVVLMAFKRLFGSISWLLPKKAHQYLAGPFLQREARAGAAVREGDVCSAKANGKEIFCNFKSAARALEAGALWGGD